MSTQYMRIDGVYAPFLSSVSGLTLNIAPDAASGSNQPGTGIVLTPGPGTGNGVPADVRTQSTFPRASGTAVQTIGDRLWPVGKTLTLSNTSNTLQAFALLSLAANTVVGGFVTYTVEANDGTDWDVASGSFCFTAVNKAGTTTVNASAETTSAQGTKGSITTAGQVAASGTSLALQVRPVFTTIVPTQVRITYTVHVNGLSTITPQ